MLQIAWAPLLRPPLGLPLRDPSAPPQDSSLGSLWPYLGHFCPLRPLWAALNLSGPIRAPIPTSPAIDITHCTRNRPPTAPAVGLTHCTHITPTHCTHNRPYPLRLQYTLPTAQAICPIYYNRRRTYPLHPHPRSSPYPLHPQ